MSWRPCRVVGCRNRVRSGLRRSGALVRLGNYGQELADGETCWRCRAKRATRETRAASREQAEFAAKMAGRPSS
jgi:hypothetical protein